MKLHTKGLWFSKSWYNNPKQVTKNVTRKENAMSTLGEKIRNVKKNQRLAEEKTKQETLDRVTKEVVLRLRADNDLLMFLDRDRDNISRYNALRGLILDFMGEVARDAWTALDRDRAKKVYRMYNSLSTGLQKAERVLMEYMLDTIDISNDRK